MRRLTTACRFFLAGGILSVLVGTSAFAEPAINCRHQVAEIGAGGAEASVTLDVTLDNTSPQNFAGGSLSLDGPLTISDPSGSALPVAYLATGESVNATWNVLIPEPTEQLSSVLAGQIYMTFSATEEGGDGVAFEVICEGGSE